MFKKIIFLSFLLTGIIASAQTYQVFKGDTINRRDKKNLPQGVWKKYYPTDTLFSECVFNNGKRVGVCRTYYKSGKPQSVLTYRGLTDACDAKIFFEDGKLKAKGKYIDKEKDSIWTYYDNFGTMIATEYYSKGKKEGSWKVYYPKGSLSQETNYRHDVKEGPYKEFFENGNRKLEAYMVKGHYEGQVILFHPNGNVREKGNYKNGLREGTWHIFKEDGTPDHDEEFKNGVNLNPSQEKEERLPEPEK